MFHIWMVKYLKVKEKQSTCNSIILFEVFFHFHLRLGNFMIFIFINIQKWTQVQVGKHKAREGK